MAEEVVFILFILFKTLWYIKLYQFKNNNNRTTNVSLVETGYNYETTNVKP